MQLKIKSCLIITMYLSKSTQNNDDRHLSVKMMRTRVSLPHVLFLFPPLLLNNMCCRLTPVTRVSPSYQNVNRWHIVTVKHKHQQSYTNISSSSSRIAQSNPTIHKNVIQHWIGCISTFKLNYSCTIYIHCSSSLAVHFRLWLTT